MNLQEVMATLQSLGTEQNRKTYQRHGSGPEVFGVSFAHLKTLAKKSRKTTRLPLSFGIPKMWMLKRLPP